MEVGVLVVSSQPDPPESEVSGEVSNRVAVEGEPEASGAASGSADGAPPLKKTKTSPEAVKLGARSWITSADITGLGKRAGGFVPEEKGFEPDEVEAALRDSRALLPEVGIQDVAEKNFKSRTSRRRGWRAIRGRIAPWIGIRLGSEPSRRVGVRWSSA